MKTLETGLYKELYQSIQYDVEYIKSYLSGENTKTIQGIQKHGIDSKYRVLFGNSELSLEVRKAIAELVEQSLRLSILTTLRQFEGDFYECEGYTGISPDDYDDVHSDYKGGLIRVVDLEGKSITDNSMYENFVGYIDDRMKEEGREYLG